MVPTKNTDKAEIYKYIYLLWDRQILFIFLIIYALLSSCTLTISPDATVRSLFQALNQGNPNRALDYLCESFLLPTLPERFLIDTECKTLTKDSNETVGHMTRAIWFHAPQGYV